ncbi:ribosome biogenesis protein bop1-B-like [Corticium candelabrum]|uniref:ribosome biogenesis protein bop1-B-like n=1 Tax=Corticium candelabrum TaxID=121492 RepID=UPI002E258267|nr:ribosome biogenesis protein bop1-B-like [Corticium candelabrum]
MAASDSEESYFSGLEEEDSSASGEESEDQETVSARHGDEEEESGNEETSGVDEGEGEGEDDDEELDDIRQQMTDNVFGDNGQTRDIQTDDVADSSDEETLNPVGDIPMEWYNDYPHIGYDLLGKKIMKPATTDELDRFLAKMDDPNWNRTVQDKTTGRDIVLTDEEVDMIQRIQTGRFPSGYDPYAPYVDWFSGDTMLHPLVDKPPVKKNFVPSKWEHKRIMKIVRAIRNGWIKPKKTDHEKPRYYLLWDKQDQESKKHPMHIPAPKMKLPGHEESYNPPAEFLPTDEEKKKWEEAHPDDRTRNFLPQKYSNLRSVPGYRNFISERFERCLDLYLCPRQRKFRVNIDPEDLIPKLPKPRELQPFPTSVGIVYEGHTDVVRTIDCDPTGEWLASGGHDCQVCFWEVSTGRCMKSLNLPFKVCSIAWCPNPIITLVAIACESIVFIVNPMLGGHQLYGATDLLISKFGGEEQGPGSSGLSELVTWSTCSGSDVTDGRRLSLQHKHVVKQVVWHGKGDYFATVMPDGGNSAVLIHQLSKRRTQNPFSKMKGPVQRVLFHPTRPHFFVATQRYIKVYNLQKQELTKKLITGVKWISSLDVHPQGDNVIMGSYDQHLCWFDLDLSAKPYKTMRHHKKAVRQVVYHRRYPLFASCSDDGTVVVFHGMVYSDLMQNPLIVPVKILHAHKVVGQLGVLDCVFHPTQPWIFSSGADYTVKLFT